MNLTPAFNFFTHFGCGFVLLDCLSRILNFLGMFLMFTFCFKILRFGWRFKGSLRFLCDFGRMPRIRLCLENIANSSLQVSNKPKIAPLEKERDPIENSSIKKSANLPGEKVNAVSEDGSEEKDEIERDFREEDEVFDVMRLRRLVKIERKKANAAIAELEKERTAAASSAEEAMAMILRLQSEKSSSEIQANQFRRMAEQKLEYDQEVIESLNWTITQHESQRDLLEDQLGFYREELKQFINEDEINQLELEADVSRDRSIASEPDDGSVVSTSENESQTFNKALIKVNPPRVNVIWKKPPVDVVKLNTNGSCLLESSSIGSGGVLRDHSGNWLCGFSSWDGHGDALLAELWGVRHGLSMAYRQGHKKLICEVDSLEAFQLLQDRQLHSFHSYAEVLGAITELLDSSSWEVQLVHILREANTCADFLAKEGSRSQKFHLFQSPPPGLGSLILKDSFSV